MTEINKYNPCSEAVEFRNQFETFQEAWEKCPRGDWMLWIASKLNVNIRTLTYVKALCAETVLHLMKDERSVNAVKVAKRFGKYKTDKKQLKIAAAAAYAADDAVYAVYAATATATATAYAAATATAAAAYAADDDDAAAAAAYAAAADAGRNNKLLTADICRKHLTKSVYRKLKL
tara:strand:+ start:5563 stop:6090 length:528 start_codon:yes stop_codon:yes gene_type:complete